MRPPACRGFFRSRRRPGAVAARGSPCVRRLLFSRHGAQASLTPTADGGCRTRSACSLHRPTRIRHCVHLRFGETCRGRTRARPGGLRAFAAASVDGVPPCRAVVPVEAGGDGVPGRRAGFAGVGGDGTRPPHEIAAAGAGGGGLRPPHSISAAGACGRVVAPAASKGGCGVPGGGDR